MSATSTSKSPTELTNVGGIGAKTAQNLLNQFNSDDIAFDAAQSIPEWVVSNIDGMGEKNIGTLRAYASDRGHNDQTDRRLSSLRGTKFTRYDDTYYACGQRDDNLCLFYTGYFQGRSYNTTFSGRQSLSRDLVNRHAWTFYSFSEHEHIILSTKRRTRNNYLADIIEDHEWKSLTDAGIVFYQQGRNHKPEHYPNTTKGWKQTSDIGGEDELRTLKLVGITKDRIALYRLPDGKTLFRFVKMPGDERLFRRLYGYTHFTTDRDFKLGEFGTIDTLVKKLDDNDEWKTYGNEVYVAEKYQQYL